MVMIKGERLFFFGGGCAVVAIAVKARWPF